jgi:hypothetical protein
MGREPKPRVLFLEDSIKELTNVLFQDYNKPLVLPVGSDSFQV